MPNIKSAMKRVKVSEAKRLQNKMKKSELRTAIRRYREAMDAKADNAETLLKVAIKKIDQAAAKKIIHRNAASRKKSQLMKAYKASV
ncbi:MAG: 30S ribosomal protein S20 [Clostridiaceae bacterium]|nr:30S ribosomal protein S20 [Clostridiaceae bacterium]HPU45414.1 30S ribosomal protein S20 [Thermoclostridium sp.]